MNLDYENSISLALYTEAEWLTSGVIDKDGGQSCNDANPLNRLQIHLLDNLLSALGRPAHGWLTDTQQSGHVHRPHDNLTFYLAPLSRVIHSAILDTTCCSIPLKQGIPLQTINCKSEGRPLI
jgi:hypothetical protein